MISWPMILTSKFSSFRKGLAVDFIQATVSSKFTLTRFGSFPFFGFLFLLVPFFTIFFDLLASSLGLYYVISLIFISLFGFFIILSSVFNFTSFVSFFFLIYWSVMTLKVLNSSKVVLLTVLGIPVLKYSNPAELL